MRTRRLAMVAVGLVCLLGLGSQALALDFYMKVNGTKQGLLKGEATEAQWQGWLPCLDLDYKAELPMDRDTGMATGVVQQLPVTITKRLGVASPQLFQALMTNEMLKQVDLSFVRTRPDGQREVYYTITLKNANLSQLRLFRSTGLAGERPAGEYEQVSFRYQTITVKHMLGNTEATADGSAAAKGPGTAKPLTIRTGPSG